MTQTPTLQAARTANLARLSAAVRRLHAAGWTWRWSTQISGSGLCEHQFNRATGLRALVLLDDDRVCVAVQREAFARVWVDVANLVIQYDVLDESALVDLIAGLS